MTSTATAIERADCAVRALSNALSVPYETAYNALESEGRKPRCRTPTHITLKAARKLGAKVTEVPLVKRESIKSLAKTVPHGHRYLAVSSGHLMPIVDGHVEDWAANTRRVVRRLFHVVPAQEQQQ